MTSVGLCPPGDLVGQKTLALPPSVPFVTRYMGGKSRLLPFLLPRLLPHLPEGGLFCDLMAGTHSVGMALRDRARVVAGDVQAYSEVIGRALLGGAHRDIPFPEIRRRLEDESQGGSRSPCHLFERIYSDTYFSLEQCREIDALRCALGRQEEPLRPILLTALFYAMSYVQSTPGHFAQFLPADHRRSAYLRQLPVRETFWRKLEELWQVPPPAHGAEVHRGTWQSLLDLPHRYDLVYLDPPYTKEQYSRFYHVLETAALYDEPRVAHKARYREDRFRSAFCLSVQAEGEFSALLARLRDSQPRATVALSYSTSGVLPLPRLLTILSRFYPSWTLSQQPYRHSTLGKGKMATAEILAVAEGRSR